MDLSAFIFVALAVAWAVYLVPKALKHHDEAVKSRSVDRFSHTMRVLARREPAAGRRPRNARLVVTPGRPASSPTVTAKRSGAPAAADAPAAPSPVRTRAARSAAARRRNVLAVLLLATLVVVGLAASGVVGWAWTAAPVAVVVAWLVACRLMVRREHGARADAPVPAPARAPRRAAPERAADAAEPAPRAEPAAEPAHVFEDTSSMPAVQVPSIDPTLWDPVPVTLPTYVTKPAAARRTVRTIELDDSGVWTSGRTDGDAAIARDAEAAERAERHRRDEGPDHRAVGS